MEVTVRLAAKQSRRFPLVKRELSSRSTPSLYLSDSPKLRR